ncbi:MAG: hypothetical protein A2509_03675 [Candidatus Edwardsbacteria bacterium RIFOXYD12_FULL_50_11]|nr:MAG: hypothetical protein A2502_03590 [Candidatus Edwardsbacteria bacterium RifOxyC12_full_54_24]OGF07796.1 MAG: hypothetical protein A2273_04840 [Candidatus Edwardsbacteria bacterium RifOxyA12_full_54_48]OGF14956.1 MAG: hypothetical protein A2509_03675 [Candidatus Edwardsbacteria bacterium RIFOXYD12_FULL_50_11]
MIGYDDDNNESGSFEVFFDDVTIEQYYPYKNQWYAERFGGNSKIDLSFNTDNYEGGAELKLNVLETTSPGTWVNGPLLRNNIDDVPVAPNMRVTWEQYDRNHSLLFELLVQGSDGQDRWLIYGANASNHWDTDQGFVDMGIGQKLPEGSGMPRASRLNVWEKFSRNINDDYFAEFDVSASSIKELRLGHFSYTGWSVGDHGGTVKNIEFTDVPVTSFVSGFEEGQYTPFADTTYENTIVPYFAGPVGAENGVNPHAGNKMYKIQGTDVNLPIAKVAAVSGAIDGKTFWNVYDPYVKIGKGSCLSFWMHVYASPTNYGQIFVDATTKSGKRFSQLIAPSNIYLCDNSGMRITPSVHKAAMGEWVNYVVNLSNSTAYPTGLENEIIDRLMIGYDDAVNDQKGNFVAYIDDIQILPNLPVYDQWSVAHFGGDPNATIGWQEQTGGGAKLVMDNNGGSVGWVNGPWAIKELFLPVSVLFDGIVNWSQYDPTHALLFALKISGADGKERWLCYSSNGQNHAGEISNDGTFGYVNMETTEAYNVWQDFSRNIYTDYNNLFTVVPRKVVAIGLGHFSYASWDGDLGGAVRDIAFRRQDRRWYTLVDIQNELALAYNNAEKITVSTDGLLHLSYSGEDSVYYTSSGDDGQTWTTPYAIEGGSLPVIAVDSKNAPAISWIKQWEPNLGGGVYFSYKTASGWSPADTLTFMDAVPWDYICGYSPPSMSITNDTVSLVYEKSYGGGIPPYISKGWALHQIRFALGNVNAKKDTVLDQYTYTVPPPWAVPTSASMATDYKGNDHIAWHKLGKIYYSMRKIDGTYSPIVEISGPGSAENPSINISGVANVVWEEDGDIYKRTGYDQKWDPIINISQSSSASMMPYICGSDILWTEDVSNDYEVFKTTYSTEKMTYVAPDNLSSTDYASIFPHEFKVQTAIGTKTYCIWAEEIEPAVLWGLTFMVDTTALEPVYAVDVGQETPSIFNVQRNGFIIYESQAKTDDNAVEPYKTVDYDSTELIYCFDNVDPNKKHKILLSFYHESGDDIKMKPYVNDLPLGEIKVKSGEEVILDKQLSEASNRDGQIIVRIEKSKGTMAVCGKILIHEVIKGNGNGKGGAQLAELGNIGQTFIYKLFQNAPNPFNGQTRISYQLAKPGNVSLKIYNTLGQLVNTLVEGHQQPGIYAAIWNGRDNSGRTTANGVYFYRLEAGDFKATKKMVILK